MERVVQILKEREFTIINDKDKIVKVKATNEITALKIGINLIGGKCNLI